MIEITNFNEFYEDNRHNYAHLLKKLSVLNSAHKLEREQQEIIGTPFLPPPPPQCSTHLFFSYTGLRTTFVFRKSLFPGGEGGDASTPSHDPMLSSSGGKIVTIAMISAFPLFAFPGICPSMVYEISFSSYMFCPQQERTWCG